jgi:pimeloyl-ACP methyl ester carboxylesterase
MGTESRKWIFIRGLGRHALHWAPFADEFKTFFPNDEIEFLDLRGNGTLAHSPSFLNIPDNVRDLRSRSKLLKKYGSIHIMSISLGSMVGVEWARTFPQEIEGLVAINTSDRGSSSFYQRMRPQNYLGILQILARSPSNEDIENYILKMTVRNPEHKKAWAQEFAKTPPTTRTNFLRQLIAAGSYLFPDHKPKTEVLLLCSEGDQLVNPACTKNIAEMWTLKPHIHPTAGHDIPLEDPTWVCREIQNWLG